MTEFFLTPTSFNEPVVNFKMAAQWQAHIHLLMVEAPDRMIEALGSDDELSAMMAAMVLIHIGSEAVPVLLKALGTSCAELPHNEGAPRKRPSAIPARTTHATLPRRLVIILKSRRKMVGDVGLEPTTR